MKIQCACGAKYAFDVTPDMAEHPITFICQSCGLDASDFVNGLIRQELGLAAPAVAPLPDTSVPVAAPPPPVPVAGSRLRISTAAAPAGPTAEVAAGSTAAQACLRHPGEICTERCVVCQKPICPKCMEHFGFVCSPLCKAKADARKIRVPVYEGQKWVVEAQYWQKIGRISAAIGAGVAVLLGFWFWYAWFGSVPHPVFSVRFTDAAHSGQSKLCGNSQLVFLHGGTLARYDIKSKKEIWSKQLVDPQLIKDAVAKASADADAVASLGKGMDMTELITQEMTAGLQLQVSGSNVWVSALDKLTHYDWNTGKVLQEIALTGGFGETRLQGNEMLLMSENAGGQEVIQHINLATGESRSEEINLPGTAGVATARAVPDRTMLALARAAAGSPTAGLPLKPGADLGKPLDPGKVAAQAQNLPLPARIALPALLANSMHQEQILREAGEGSDEASAQALRNLLGNGSFDEPWRTGAFSLIPSEYGNLQFAVRIVQTNIVEREAMKAPPAKSVLDSGNLNVTKTADVANEILNEMQRSHGGSTVQEDDSRYQVTIHRPDSADTADWTGEVVGPPALFPLKTVNVLTAGKNVIVVDKSNKKLWQATLAYSVPAGAGILGEGANTFSSEKSPYGDGPCVEHGDTLYIFDQAVLTAFDLATGNPRWRLPSVGIAGLFFDDKGMLYVNSTTASPENIKYAKQIDISQTTDAVFLKLDPKTGRILWKMQPGNFISYLSGKFIYTYYVNHAGGDSGLADLAGITPTPSFVRIRRINPRNGEIMWDYQQKRAPLDVQFDRNIIQFVFKREVQVLKFISL
ncbi:MAG TPA: PQQ-binding-like beta-propeller repeat protein [Verrucomicrobiae bacterium]|nr:PQQ-binding-like beta-propeller repeat protein [Verrucomicrobiae bacterium]